MARTSVDIRADPAYFEALARFCYEFSILEAVMFNTLAFYAKVTNRMARAVFSGARVRTAMGFIERIVQIEDPGEENKKDLKCIFKKLKAINTFRDDILHQGSILTDDKGRITSNIVRNLTPERPKERSASTETLNAATADLRKVCLHLACHYACPQASLAQRAALEGCEVLNDPWQYKVDQ